MPTDSTPVAWAVVTPSRRFWLYQHDKLGHAYAWAERLSAAAVVGLYKAEVQLCLGERLHAWASAYHDGTLALFNDRAKADAYAARFGHLVHHLVSDPLPEMPDARDGETPLGVVRL